jgi:hypothetical protein
MLRWPSEASGDGGRANDRGKYTLSAAHLARARGGHVTWMKAWHVQHDPRGVVMRFPLAVIGAVAASAVLGAQGRGAVTEVSATPTGDGGNVKFEVRGNNPCGAVFLDFGDGTPGITYPISQLPATMFKEYFQNGTFRVTARGMGNCDGSAPAEVRVTRARPQPAPPPQPDAPRPPAPAPVVRFAEMDENRDGVITRAEWRGSARSFASHDWNGDGRLSGEEVRIGAAWPTARGRGLGSVTATNDWTETRFRQLDRNGDARISLGEWRYEHEDFFRVDRNGDNILTLNEFLIGDVDDDRGDRFDDLDLDGNNRLDRREWHGSLAAFQWLDRNSDGMLTRSEVVGENLGRSGGGSRRGGTAELPRVVMVYADREWTDTAIDLRAGDLLDATATGRIFFAPGNSAAATAAGAGPATAGAPLPGRNIGGLVGRIGNGPAFFVGDNLSAYRAEGTGRLYLRVNDDVLTDNRGQFRATITVTRR